MNRKPAAAGRFYTADREALREEIAGYVGSGPKRRVYAVVAPHAGYPYSGACAGAVYGQVEVPATTVILGPNHTGLGEALAIMAEGKWEMPMGDVEIDSGLARAVVEECPDLVDDTLAHSREHSLEVQVPFLQYLNEDAKIVPIAIGALDYDRLAALGEGLAGAISKKGEDVLIVASSDMSHTQNSDPERQEMVHRKDMMAIEAMEKLDQEGLSRVVREEGITMCGWAPAVVAIGAARKLGASQGKLVKYTTSWDTTHDYSYVVGYAGIIID